MQLRWIHMCMWTWRSQSCKLSLGVMRCRHWHLDSACRRYTVASSYRSTEVAKRRVFAIIVAFSKRLPLAQTTLWGHLMPLLLLSATTWLFGGHRSQKKINIFIYIYIINIYIYILSIYIYIYKFPCAHHAMSNRWWSLLDTKTLFCMHLPVLPQRKTCSSR